MYELLDDGRADAAFERLEARLWLSQALAHLGSEAQQQVIIDKYFYELGDEEIARRMGKSTQAVWSLRHRGLRNLRRVTEYSVD